MLSFFCKEFNIPAAKLLAHNFRTTFYTSAQAIQLTTNEQLVGFFKTLALSNRTESIFVKPQMGKGGKGAFLLHMSTLKEQLEAHGDDLRSGFYVFQETIVQHPEIGRIYPHSINTLRISTYRDDEGILHTLPIVMRFGVGGSVVDNKSSGGLYVVVDQAQACLGSIARTELTTGSTDFSKHPDTGIIFANYKIPYFSEARTFCEQLASLLPNRFTGWDIAITADGPMLVEANANPNLTLGELEHGGYLQYPVFQKILANSR